MKLFSWIAGIALVLAAVFFLKYSVEHGWLNPSVRAAIGIATGVALIVICELRVARDYSTTANAMHGAGIAILYATLFAMHARWHLVSPAAAFGLMLIVTAVAVYLSVRRDSVLIALLGLLGGFATPALLSTGENRPIVLFSYLFLLNAGIAGIAFWKRWPALTALSILLTAIYQWGWIVRFLTASQLPLAAGIFVVFAVLAAIGLWLGRRTDEDSKQAHFDRAAMAGAALPLLFAIFTAALPAYGARYNTLFGFLLLIVAGLAAIAIARGLTWLQQLGGIVTLITFAVWVALSYPPVAWPAVLVWLAVFVALHLAVAAKLNGSGADTAALLLFMIPALAAVEESVRTPALLFTTALLLVAMIGVYAIRYAAPRPYLIASVLTYAGVAVWMARHLHRSTAGSLLTILTALALLALAIAVAASRFRRSVTPHVAIGVYLFLLVVVLHRGMTIPPTLLFAALTAVGVACAVVALHLKRPSLLTASVIGAQLTLLAWSEFARAVPWPAMACAATVAVVAIALGCYALDRSFVTAAASSIVLAQVVVMVVSSGSGASFPLIVATHLVLLSALLVVAWTSGSHALATIDALLTALAPAVADTLSPGQEAGMAAAIYLPFVAFPLLLGKRTGSSLHPYLAAVLASVPFFFYARHATYHADLQHLVGLLPLAQAALLGLLILRLLRIEPKGERNMSRLALVGAAALAFVTVAVPVQLEKQWILIAWALEAAALIWLYRRVPHQGLLQWAAGLYFIVFIMLVFNPAVYDWHPASGRAIVNWYLYTWLVPAVAFFVGARMLPAGRRRYAGALAAGGTAILFVLLNVEIADFYSSGETLTFNFLSSSLAQDLTYTIGWAVFAVSLLIAGIVLQARGARIAALALLVVTILKCFVHDLGRLGGLYRVGSLLGLAISLVLVGILLQRFVMKKRQPQPEEAS